MGDYDDDDDNADQFSADIFTDPVDHEDGDEGDELEREEIVDDPTHYREDGTAPTRIDENEVQPNKRISKWYKLTKFERPRIIGARAAYIEDGYPLDESVLQKVTEIERQNLISELGHNNYSQEELDNRVSKARANSLWLARVELDLTIENALANPPIHGPFPLDIIRPVNGKNERFSVWELV